MLDLRDRVVVVTGASSGIGRELALLLARKGTRVAAAARRGERLASLKREVEAQGGALLAVECDVGDCGQVERLRDAVWEVWGPAEVLVNNAGRGAHGPIEQLAIEDIETLVRTNLLGAIYCTRAFLPAMLERGRGHLVFVSSVLGELPAPYHAVYGATKFAMTGLAESLEYELRPRGIRVTLVEPGLVRTEFPQVSGTPGEFLESVPSRSAEEVALEIVRALEREKRRIVPDRLARVGIDFRRHFPRTAHLFFRLAFRRVYGK
jgi:short-subunit dehydrogenase